MSFQVGDFVRYSTDRERIGRITEVDGKRVIDIGNGKFKTFKPSTPTLLGEPSLYDFYLLAERGNDLFIPLYEQYPFDLNYSGPLLDKDGDNYWDSNWAGNWATSRRESFLSGPIGGIFNVPTLRVADFMLKHGAIPDKETWKMALENLGELPNGKDIWDHQIIYEVIDGFLKHEVDITIDIGTFGPIFLNLMKTKPQLARVALSHEYIRSMDGIAEYIPEEVKKEYQYQLLESARELMTINGVNLATTIEILNNAFYNGATKYNGTLNKLMVLAKEVEKRKDYSNQPL